MRHTRIGSWLPTFGSLLLCLCPSSCSMAPKSPAPLPPPVSYQHVVRRDPNFSIHVVKIHLSDPRVSVRVSRGGTDPDGDGPWLTTLLPASEIADREHYDIAINGDFFTAEATQDVEGRNTGYVKGKSAAPRGTSMTDGQIWHRAETTRPYLEITSSKVARLAEGRPSDLIDPAARQIVGGGQIIVRDGKAVAYINRFAMTRNPRTVVGLDQTGTQLTFLVVDGRQPELSIGMTLTELSDAMISLGCDSAINLDGGGSSTLVYRDPKTKKLKIVNSPSDTKERSVADVLGVTVKAPLPEAK
jgi:exopolysaccharide biosynthesis protein